MFGFARKNRKTPPILTSKLGVEMLEAREVPAVWDPLNGSKDSNLAQNWLANTSVSSRYSPGTFAISAGEDLIFGAIIDAYQTYNPLYGQPGQPITITVPSRVVTADCDLKQLASGSPYGPPPPPIAEANFYGVRLLEPYTGTVTLLQDAKIAQLDVHNGHLKQANPTTLNVNPPVLPNGGKVTVENHLLWTGGMINVGGWSAFLDIDASATGLINPGEDISVTTGNTITLLGTTIGSASILTLQSGSLELSNGHGIGVNSNATLQLGFNQNNQINAPIKKVKIKNVDPEYIGDHEVDKKAITIFAKGTMNAGKENNGAQQCDLSTMDIATIGIVNVRNNTVLKCNSYFQGLLPGDKRSGDAALNIYADRDSATTGLYSETKVEIEYSHVDIHAPDCTSENNVKSASAFIESKLKNVVMTNLSLMVYSNKKCSSELIVVGDLTFKNFVSVYLFVSPGDAADNVFGKLTVTKDLILQKNGDKHDFRLAKRYDAMPILPAVTRTIVQWQGIGLVDDTAYDFNYGDYDNTEYLWSHPMGMNHFTVK